jgi:hypothetical protein
MSLVDDIFASIPAPLIDQFGIDATYIKASQNQTYNPETGTVSGYSVEIAVRIVISSLKPREVQGDIQHTDVRILIAASSLSGYYPQITDSIRYTQNGVQRTARIIAFPNIDYGTVSYRGDNAIMHSVVARLS